MTCLVKPYTKLEAEPSENEPDQDRVWPSHQCYISEERVTYSKGEQNILKSRRFVGVMGFTFPRVFWNSGTRLLDSVCTSSFRRSMCVGTCCVLVCVLCSTPRSLGIVVVHNLPAIALHRRSIPLLFILMVLLDCQYHVQPFCSSEYLQGMPF
jgi:hypothetical protein